MVYVSGCMPGRMRLRRLEGIPRQAISRQRVSERAADDPGCRVQCAYYDFGGEGVAYHETDATNHGSGALNPANGEYLNEFRMHEGVDISYTKFKGQVDNSPYDLVTPQPGQLYVGWTQPGEWFNVTVNVKRAGRWQLLSWQSTSLP